MNGALLTDLYQLTMLKAFYDHGMNAPAAFEFFVRKRPAQRNFLVAAGLEQVLEFLETLRFTAEELEWLRRSGLFHPAFVDSLAHWRFTGEVYAMAEGTIFFPPEPILRVEAPLREAQLVESRLINLLQYQTLIASKAARMVLAAPGKTLIDFGLRRAHGAEAALLSARAGYLAGLSGTSTVLAGKLWDIPLFGTMAHSYVQVHASETLAFERFADSFPNNTTCLIDTYDTEAAAVALIPLARRLLARGIRLQGVRLDSGDLAQHAWKVRRILDEGGLHDLRIFASGDLDEFTLRTLAASAPIDGFGIGTRMSTSSDAPYLDCAYKLQEYDGQPKRKRSEGKVTWPGRKQVYRQYDARGRFAGDILTVSGDHQPGEPLLLPVMRGGVRLTEAPPLSAIRAHTARQLAALPEDLRTLDEAPAYPVHIAQALHALARHADAGCPAGG